MLRGALASKLNLADLAHDCPRPPLSQRGEIGRVRLRSLSVLSFSVPFLTTFSEDAVEKLGAGFVRSAFLAGKFGFGGHEFAFASGFEDGGAVAFEVGLHAPQARDSRLQPC